MNEGICVAGPLAGERWESRYPKGFLLIDKPNGKCWIYEWDGICFKVRDEEPMPILTEGPKNRFRAAEEFNYDVVAAPWGGE